MRRRHTNGKYARDFSYLLPALWLLIGTVGLQIGLGWHNGLTQRLFLGETDIAKAETSSGVVQNDITLADSVIATTSATPVPALHIEPDDMSVFISQAVQEFLPTHESEALMIMHCLAHRENGHGANNKCGDNGKACGPFQFWQPTWEGYRKLMIKEGLATEIGDRYDKKESARTTAWALSTGRGKAWGPILREIQGKDYATCQAPSWSSK